MSSRIACETLINELGREVNYHSNPEGSIVCKIQQSVQQFEQDRVVTNYLDYSRQVSSIQSVGIM